MSDVQLILTYLPQFISIYLNSIPSSLASQDQKKSKRTAKMRHKKDGLGKNHKKTRHYHPPQQHSREDENSYNVLKPAFKAACWDLGHCAPKRCSGKRLMHFGLMRELLIGQKFSGVVIS